MKIFAAFLLPILAISAAPVQQTAISAFNAARQGRIVGGRPATAGQYKSSAAIYQTTPDGTYFCGGALISRQYVLTAGHCVQEATVFTILLGIINLTGDPNQRRITASQHILHQFFNPDTFAADIGLIKFNLPIEYNDYIQAITIPIIDIQNSDLADAIGFGDVNDEDGGNNDHLRTVVVTRIPNNECQNFFSNPISADMICVQGNDNEGACRGDLGSPLIQTLQNHQMHVGVSSFISGQGCEAEAPSGYASTYEYRDWIRENANITVGPES